MRFFIWFLLYSGILLAEAPSGKLKALYNSLDPTSIAQHLAFYELYPTSREGDQALREAYRLLTGSPTLQAEKALPILLSPTVESLVTLITKHADEENLELNDEEIALIDRLAQRLPNRKLAGFRATSEQEVMLLDPKEIDLARGVLLSQLGDQATRRKIKSYEAAIDLMALQILARVSMQDPPKTKIRVLNQFIFEEMGFRFPPHAAYAKDIDLYTFLPSVLDSRRGVCLGVSILYICLAQRLNLELEIVTPPGHIFVRCKNGEEVINIETTARGVHVPDEEYLGVDTRALQKRNIKETIGMAHFNQASVFLERQEYDKAMSCYEKALIYVPEDKLILSLMGYTALVKGDESKARGLLDQVADYFPDHAVSKETIAEDYLQGNASLEAMQAMFMHVDETRHSLLAKRDALIKGLEKTPHFREGIFSLAGTWLQLHRASEALETLKRYHELDPNNATVEYYLSALYAERIDYNNAWHHLRQAEKLVKARNHSPEALLSLRQELAAVSPE